MSFFIFYCICWIKVLLQLLLIQTYCNISNFSCLPWNKLYSEFWSDQIEHLTGHKPFLSVFAVCIDSNLCRVPPAAIISHLAPAREYRHNWLPSFPHSTLGLSLYHRCFIIVTSLYQDIDDLHHMESKSPKKLLFFWCRVENLGNLGGWVPRMEDGSLRVLFLALLPCTITEDT